MFILSEEELRLKLIAANSKIQLGAMYRHVKSGQVYTVAQVSLWEEDLEPVVTYSSISSDVSFTRKLIVFIQKFEKMPPAWKT